MRRLLLAMVFSVMISQNAAHAGIEPLVMDARSDDHYRAPTMEEAGEWRAAFRAVLSGGPVGPVKDMGMAVVEHPEALVVREAAQRQGRGFYAYRKGSAEPLLVQAPHQFADLHTGVILARLFDENHVPAVAFNTVHRRAEGGDPADLTHAETSVLRSFTLAYMDVHPRARVVQLHGFAQEKRKNATAGEADVIVSAGVPTPSNDVVAVARCLERALGVTALVFGINTTELGATRNVVGQAVREAGASFVHVELSLGLRLALKADAGLRSRFAACLREG